MPLKPYKTTRSKSGTDCLTCNLQGLINNPQKAASLLIYEAAFLLPKHNVYLYIMPLHKANIYSYTQPKRWWLALTLFLSFFALSGYVSNTPQNSIATPTEQVVLSNGHLKNAISYKRAQSLFYNKSCVNPAFRTDNNTAVFIYNKIVNTQYLRLKQLALLKPRLIIVLNGIPNFSASEQPASQRA